MYADYCPDKTQIILNPFNSSPLVLCIKFRLTLRIFPELNYTFVCIQTSFLYFILHKLEHHCPFLVLLLFSSSFLQSDFMCFQLYSWLCYKLGSYSKSNCIYHDRGKTSVLFHYVFFADCF